MATLTLQQAAAYARAAGFTGNDLVDIVAVATPESSLSTTVVNSIGCVGVWQINQPVHVKDHPNWTVQWLQDPANNATAAKVIFDQQGMSAWESWTTGKAAGYLPAAQVAVASVGGGTATGTATSAAFTSTTTPTATPADLLGDSGKALGSIAHVVIAAAAWVANPDNWSRLIYVVIGGGLILVGLEAVGVPVMTPVTMALPEGKVLTAATKMTKAVRK